MKKETFKVLSHYITNILMVATQVHTDSPEQLRQAIYRAVRNLAVYNNTIVTPRLLKTERKNTKAYIKRLRDADLPTGGN